MSKYIKVVVGDENGERVAIAMRRDGATGLDVLGFMRGVADLFDMEALAAAEGRTFDHPLASAVGALPIGDITRGRE